MVVKVPHTCIPCRSQERLEEISQYTSEDMKLRNFRDPNAWDDLVDILIYHPSSITRHEASFIIAELDDSYLTSRLMQVVKFDRSIVAKHEAVEALGRTTKDVKRVYQFLRNIITPGIYDDEVYHPDVQATAQESMRALKKQLNAA